MEVWSIESARSVSRTGSISAQIAGENLCRAAKIDNRISIATVYRTVRLFEEAGIISRHDFRDGRARYEEAPETHHDHLIDMKTGKVVEFVDEEIEALQQAIARKLGYRLVDHRLELYGVPIED